MPDQKKLDFEIPVSGRLSETLVKKVDRMAERSWRDRSKILRAILSTVLGKIDEEDAWEQPLEQVIRRLRLDPA
jgi:metal-responsive CopG/Arc/MetJ family transcriptional regulator